MTHVVPANHSNKNRVITILIQSDKTRFQNVFVTLPRRRLNSINPMIFMPQIFDVIANGNARYTRNELEFIFILSKTFK